MKKLFLAIALLAVIAMLCGCGEKTTVTKTGEYESEITTEEGEVKISGTVGAESWCPAGGDWTATWTAPGTEGGAGTATWKVDKLMTSGKYEGLCHVIYTSTTEEGTTTVDYYFSEDGESGYWEMVMPDGSTFSQEFHK
jgi:curli biogenesis system outer membrane secretion channel CsgG